MSSLKRSYTLVKERFENVDLSGSSEYASNIYRRASKASQDAAKAAREQAARAYSNAGPTMQTVSENASTTAQSWWTSASKFATSFYKPRDMTLKATLAKIDGAPFGRVGHSIAVIKGRAYIFGGETVPGTPANNDMAIIFLPAYEAQSIDYTTVPARSVKTSGPVPSARKNHTAVVVGDVICIFGGELTGSDTEKEQEKEGRIWTYDTSTKAWDVLDPSDDSPYPAPRFGHAACGSEFPEAPDTRPKIEEDILPQQPPEPGKYLPEPAAPGTWGTMFIYGGTATRQGATSDNTGQNEELLNDAWAFDLRARSWFALPPPPGPARTGASLACAGNAIWRFGGFDGENYVGHVLDRLEVGGLWSFSARGTALSELARASGIDEWETRDFNDVAGKVPCPRANAALVDVVTGPGRENLVLLGGQGRTTTRGVSGKGKEKTSPVAEDGETQIPAPESQGSDEAPVRVLDDIWTFQLPTQPTAYSLRDPVQDSVSETMGSPWKEVSYRYIDAEGEIQDDNSVGETMTMGKALRRRVGFAVGKGSEIDGATFIVWGGVDGREKVRSDGFMATIES